MPNAEPHIWMETKNLPLWKNILKLYSYWAIFSKTLAALLRSRYDFALHKVKFKRLFLSQERI